MELRIIRHEGSDSGSALQLEGRVIAYWAALLESECTDLLQSHDEVSLDLADVSFIDRYGVEVFQRLSQAGAEILCTSGPVASVLEGAGVRVTVEGDDGRP